jgi:4-aminobutyrate aminotransferase and related aminotransferases
LPADEVACVLIEPIQGDGGIRKAPEEFMQLVYDFCHQNGILFAVDEINQGMGRTGKMWSYQQFKDIEPDLMSVGKSLASGMPLSATIGKRKSCRVLIHQHTSLLLLETQSVVPLQWQPWTSWKKSS